MKAQRTLALVAILTSALATSELVAQPPGTLDLSFDDDGRVDVFDPLSSSSSSDLNRVVATRMESGLP